MPDTTADAPAWTTTLRSLSACVEAVEWGNAYPSLEAVWPVCERGDWMLWYAGRLAGPAGSDARRPLVLAACDCAALALPIWEARYPDDQRPRAAIETAQRWARGDADVTVDMVRASSSASAAAAAAYASAAAAAAYAASAAVDAYAAASRKRVLRECAEIVRCYYPTPPTRSES